MRKTKRLMGMHITVDIVGNNAFDAIDEVFDYFQYVDGKFSTYKKSSEVEKINDELIKKNRYSSDMSEVLALAQKTKIETKGYFDVYHNGKLDPSGIVKGWAIYNASLKIRSKGFSNFYIDAGGDIEAGGVNREGNPWRVGIRNPFNTGEIVKVVGISNKGIATSGNYERGEHIYNPKGGTISDVVSMTVIGPSVLEADRFATAAFAMGVEGAKFIDGLDGFEAYLVKSDKRAIATSGFEKYVVN